MSRKIVLASFAIVVFVSLFLGAAGTAMAQHHVRTYTVVGAEPATVKVEEQVESFSNPQSEDPTIANATYRENGIHITGRRPGVTRIIFNARKGIVAAGAMGTKPFQYRITVRVLPPKTDVRPTANYPVSVGDPRSTNIGSFLHTVFADPKFEGVRWRNVQAESSDETIATAELYNNRLGVRILKISGHKRGKATVVLTGEELIENAWRLVIKEFNVIVTGGNSSGDKAADDQPESVAADPANDGWPDYLEKRFETLKNQSARIGPDDPNWALMMQEFEQFIVYLDSKIAEERKSPRPREERLSRLKQLRDKASQEFERLREKQIISDSENPKGGSLTGNWHAIFRGVETPGFRIEESNGRVKLLSANRIVVFEGTRQGQVITGQSALRAGETDTGRRLSRQLRVSSDSNQLELWGKRLDERLQETGEFYSLGIIYIRDKR
jgi:hypothetical protein